MQCGRIGIALIGVFAIAACQSQSALVTQKEDNLAAAGFMVRPANTPERIAMLNRLPPHQFVQRVNRDAVHYVYADPWFAAVSTWVRSKPTISTSCTSCSSIWLTSSS